MKKILKIISMMLMLSFFAVPMTACVSDSGYPEDEAFGKFGVTVTKSENYETDKRITLNTKDFFDPLRIESVSFSESSESSWLPRTIKRDLIAFYKLKLIFDQELTFELTEDTEPTLFYAFSFRISSNDCSVVRLYFDKEGKLYIQTDKAIYRCTDIRDLDIKAIDEFIALERGKSL